MNVTTSTITRALVLLNLPDPVKDLVVSNRLAPSLAHAIARRVQPEDQHALAERVVTKNLSRSQLMKTLNPAKHPADPNQATTENNTYKCVFATKIGQVVVNFNQPVDVLAILEAL